MKNIHLILTIFVLILLSSACNFPGSGTVGEEISPTITPQPTAEAPTPTLEPEPTATYALPEGFQDYQDPLTGITVSIPEDWWITGVVEGDYAILQSYPPDKYVGGSVFQPGDTKCDLNIKPGGTTPEELIQEWTADGMTEILSREEITLSGGVPAIRLEIQSMGESVAQIAELHDRLVTLICFGDPGPFPMIADTVR